MTTDNGRTRGIAVFPMPEEVGGPKVLARYALVIRDNDLGFEGRMVHSEGVAYLVKDDKPWCWTDYDPTQRQWSLTELVDYIGTHKIEPVDLADWVRVHNRRLEQNFVQILHWAFQGEEV